MDYIIILIIIGIIILLVIALVIYLKSCKKQKNFLNQKCVYNNENNKREINDDDLEINDVILGV